MYYISKTFAVQIPRQILCNPLGPTCLSHYSFYVLQLHTFEKKIFEKSFYFSVECRTERKASEREKVSPQLGDGFAYDMLRCAPILTQFSTIESKHFLDNISNNSYS